MSEQPVFFKLVFLKENPNIPITTEAEIHTLHDGKYLRLTPRLTNSEFDGYIDHLISELEHIRREGKRKFSKLDKRL